MQITKLKYTHTYTCISKEGQQVMKKLAYPNSQRSESRSPHWFIRWEIASTEVSVWYSKLTRTTSRNDTWNVHTGSTRTTPLWRLWHWHRHLQLFIICFMSSPIKKKKTESSNPYPPRDANPPCKSYQIWFPHFKSLAVGFLKIYVDLYHHA